MSVDWRTALEKHEADAFAHQPILVRLLDRMNAVEQAQATAAGASQRTTWLVGGFVTVILTAAVIVVNIIFKG